MASRTIPIYRPLLGQSDRIGDQLFQALPQVLEYRRLLVLAQYRTKHVTVLRTVSYRRHSFHVLRTKTRQAMRVSVQNGFLRDEPSSTSPQA